MNAAVPIVERADDTDPLSVRCPNGEACAVHAIDYAQVRTEFVVNAQFVSLSEEIDVHLAECRQEGKRIAELTRVAVRIGNNKIVSVNGPGFRCSAFKNTGVAHLFQCEAWLVF